MTVRAVVFEELEETQPAAVGLLRGALQRSRVHHGYRFEGPPGAGKERAALALAQSLLCERGGAIGCGRCSACERATNFSEGTPQLPRHPDVVLVQRGLYPPQMLGRASPETAGIGVEQIRKVVLERCGFPPHEGRALIFIIRDANELTPAAANALLKTLEEPRRGIHFVLLTDRPRALLDTVRSRTLPIRFGRLSDSALRTLLERRGLDPQLASLSSGSLQRAIELSQTDGLAQARSFVQSVRQALRAPDLSAALELSQSVGGQRETLQELLGGLRQYLLVRARQRAGAGESFDAQACAHAYADVGDALHALARFSPPVLTLETLIARLRRRGLSRG